MEGWPYGSVASYADTNPPSGQVILEIYSHNIMMCCVGCIEYRVLYF